MLVVIVVLPVAEENHTRLIELLASLTPKGHGAAIAIDVEPPVARSHLDIEGLTAVAAVVDVLLNRVDEVLTVVVDDAALELGHGLISLEHRIWMAIT